MNKSEKLIKLIKNEVYPPCTRFDPRPECGGITRVKTGKRKLGVKAPSHSSGGHGGGHSEGGH